MPANTAPIYPAVPFGTWCVLSAANTTLTGVGTVGVLCTAGTEHARVDRIRCKALGTNVATVARVFENNGSDNTVAANNVLIAEIPLPPTSASNDDVVSPEIWHEILKSIKNGYRITIALGTAVSAGWAFSPDGGRY